MVAREEFVMIGSRPIFLLTMLLIFTQSSCGYAAEMDQQLINAQAIGVWTITPPLMAIIFAFITKNVMFSLFVGIMSGSFILKIFEQENIFWALLDSFLSVSEYALKSLSDPWNAGIVLQCLTIGGLIALITKMGGARALAEALAKKAQGPVSTQIFTWVMGLMIFFDDYANSLIVGPIMKPVADKFKVSREKLAFVIDATAAPIAGLALISTWIGYELSLIRDGYLLIDQNVNAYAVFIETIPYRFYNILILCFVLFSAYTLRDFGSMYTAEVRTRRSTEKPVEEKQKVIEKEISLERCNMWNAIVPIAVLIVASFIGFYTNGRAAILTEGKEELGALFAVAPFSLQAIQEAFGASDASIVLFQGALLACVVAIIMGFSQKLFTLQEATEAWIGGVKELASTGVVLLLAWSISGVIKDMGTAKYVSMMLSDTLPAFILPSIIFLLGAVISFSTGTAYGTMGILMPLAIPLAASIDPTSAYITMNVGAVLTGAIFGDHCSPISDTTILSSMGAGCNHLDHVKTQIPYALSVAAITVIFGYLPVGLGLPIYIVLPISISAVYGLLILFGKRVE